jgi:hypothetical protein
MAVATSVDLTNPIKSIYDVPLLNFPVTAAKKLMRWIHIPTFGSKCDGAGNANTTVPPEPVYQSRIFVRPSYPVDQISRDAKGNFVIKPCVRLVPNTNPLPMAVWTLSQLPAKSDPATSSSSSVSTSTPTAVSEPRAPKVEEDDVIERICRKSLLDPANRNAQSSKYKVFPSGRPNVFYREEKPHPDAEFWEMMARHRLPGEIVDDITFLNKFDNVNQPQQHQQQQQRQVHEPAMPYAQEPRGHVDVADRFAPARVPHWATVTANTPRFPQPVVTARPFMQQPSVFSQRSSFMGFGVRAAMTTTVAAF